MVSLLSNLIGPARYMQETLLCSQFVPTHQPTDHNSGHFSATQEWPEWATNTCPKQHHTFWSNSRQQALMRLAVMRSGVRPPSAPPRNSKGYRHVSPLVFSWWDTYGTFHN